MEGQKIEIDIWPVFSLRHFIKFKSYSEQEVEKLEKAVEKQNRDSSVPRTEKAGKNVTPDNLHNHGFSWTFQRTEVTNPIIWI